MSDFGSASSRDLKTRLREIASGALPRWRGKDVRGFRDDLEMSQSELARLCGVTRQTVAIWEASPRKTIPELASRWLHALDEALD